MKCLFFSVRLSSQPGLEPFSARSGWVRRQTQGLACGLFPPSPQKLGDCPACQCVNGSGFDSVKGGVRGAGPLPALCQVSTASSFQPSGQRRARAQQSSPMRWQPDLTGPDRTRPGPWAAMRPSHFLPPPPPAPGYLRLWQDCFNLCFCCRAGFDLMDGFWPKTHTVRFYFSQKEMHPSYFFPN